MQLIQIHEPGETPMPHEGGASVGIDLGTTHSLVAISNQGVQEVITDEQGRALLPSVVYYAEDGAVTVGYDAIGKAGAIHSVKRLMAQGVPSFSPSESEGGNPETTMLDSQPSVGRLRMTTPIQVSAEILKILKARAEDALDNTVDKAVITVPAYFDDAARQATKDAAALAGLEVLRLVNEPTAAALAYGLDNGAEGIYAIYDLGGGTFDVSLLKMEKGVFQVLATGGDTQLGGDDMDALVAEWWGHPPLTPPASSGGCLQLARQAKEYLTEHDSWQQGGVSLTRSQLNSLITPLVERTIETFRRVLIDADVARADVQGVVLVGGSTRVPLVRQMVEDFMGRPALTNVDPDKVVAIGAALQAEALTQGSDNLLLDVCPLSLGLETYGGLVEVVIPRNTPIPVAKAQQFTTYQDGQTGMDIHILQGEREVVELCRSLAKFQLKGIPPMQAGVAIIEVLFMLDADGLLTVSARETTTNTQAEVQVKPSYGLPPEQMEQMLRESMEHAQEDITRRLLVESRVEAEMAVKATRDALAVDNHLLTAEELKPIEQQLQHIEQLMQDTDRDSIDYAVKELEKICSPFVEKRVNQALGSYLQGKKVENF